MKTRTYTLLVVLLSVFPALAQIITPISNGVLKTDLNADGFQIDSVGQIGFGTSSPSSRISILPAGNPTTNADGIRFGPDVYTYRSGASTLTITGNLVVSGSLTSGSGAVTLSGTNAWTGINSYAGVTTFNGPTTIGNSGLTFTGGGAAATRTALSLVPGTNVQAYSARLAEIAALGVSPAGFMYANGSNWVVTSASSTRTALGLSTADSVTFDGLTLTTNPLGVTSGGTGLTSIAANRILYTSGSNTLAATELSAYIRASLLPAADASAAITALTLNSLTGALSGSILNPSLAANAVTTTSVSANAITTAKIADGAVTSAKLALSGATAGTYGGASSIPQITVNGQGQITTISNVASSGILSSASLDSGSHLTGTYGVPLIKDGVVTDAKMTASGVSAGIYGDATTIPQITVNAQGRITLATGVSITALTSGSAATGVMTGSTYANLQLAAGSITSAKIATGAVETGNILDGTIAAADLASGAVTADKIAALAVTAAKIAANTITASQIANGAIGTDQIAGSSVTAAKMAGDAVALGTGTTGNYVRTIAGTNITVAGSGAESADVTVSIPQSVATTATPTFAGLTITDTASIKGITSPGYGIHVSKAHPGAVAAASRAAAGLSAYDATRPFTTITGALAAASAGDTIYVYPGGTSVTDGYDYQEDLAIANNVTIVGVGDPIVRGGFTVAGGLVVTLRDLVIQETVANDTPPIRIYDNNVQLYVDSRVQHSPGLGDSGVFIGGNNNKVYFRKNMQWNSPLVAGASFVEITGTGNSIFFENGSSILYDPVAATSTVNDNIYQINAVSAADTNKVRYASSVALFGKIAIAGTDTDRVRVMDAPANETFSYQYSSVVDNILDNTTGTALAFDVTNSGVPPRYPLDQILDTTISGSTVFRPIRRGLLRVDVCVGLTPTGLTDVVAGDRVILSLQTSADGAVWADLAILDSYTVSIAGGGPLFVLKGGFTIPVTAPASFSGTGGYRIAIKCATAGGAGVNGSYVKSTDTTYTYMQLDFRNR